MKYRLHIAFFEKCALLPAARSAGFLQGEGVISISGSPERNGNKPPLNRMAADMLRRIRDFTKRKREEGEDVYLSRSGIPFTVEGNKNGVKGMSVDIEAIDEVLDTSVDNLEEEKEAVET